LTSKNKIGIYKLLSLRVNSYLVGNKNNFLLIDTGYKGSRFVINRSLKKLKVNPSEIRYIILTHTHFDHSYNTEYFRRITGAKIIVHKTEADCLINGLTRIPFGTNTFSKVSSFLGKNVFPIIKKIPKSSPDIIIENELEISIAGLSVKIISTPGHSVGSLSIIVNNEFAFVGDTLFGIFKNDIFPPFADNSQEMLKSWKKLAETGCSVFYPGHGKPITIDRLERNLKSKQLNQH
jgi:glyoxylase-like metal-dependent hydrolase (beta-lactamase superfamily II)